MRGLRVVSSVCWSVVRRRLVCSSWCGVKNVCRTARKRHLHACPEFRTFQVGCACVGLKMACVGCVFKRAWVRAIISTARSPDFAR